ncbi:unnamed protein product, partial [Rotaria magnacalcarata]
MINNNLQTSIIEHEKQTSSPSSSTTTTTTVSDNTVLPIYILPPLYTTSTSLHINTNDTIPKW